ncbi:glutathione S-transferase-like [Watersipora subatra]|uniref:glutathione S-transferase-like n=1 Tax=Watersipora subatra TaxID=2589382 RepID=UPI00355C754E
MASTDKLTYFHAYARAEPTRMLYALHDKPLADNRVTKDGWPSLKKDQPLGQMPVLECDEGTLLMSNSIARYTAKKFGVMGRSLWEEALNDMVVEVCSDCFQDLLKKIYEWEIFKRCPEPDNSVQLKAGIKDRIVKSMHFLQSIAEQRNRKFIINDQMNLADVWLYNTLQFGIVAFPDIMELTPWVKEFVAKVQNEEKMKAYLASRPKTPFGI